MRCGNRVGLAGPLGIQAGQADGGEQVAAAGVQGVLGCHRLVHPQVVRRDVHGEEALPCCVLRVGHLVTMTAGVEVLVTDDPRPQQVDREERG